MKREYHTFLVGGFNDKITVVAADAVDALQQIANMPGHTCTDGEMSMWVSKTNEMVKLRWDRKTRTARMSESTNATSAHGNESAVA